MGLDTIITGDIAEIVSFNTEFAMTRDPYDGERMCSGVMMWKDTDLYEKFVADDRKTAENYKLAGVFSDMKWLEIHGKPDEHNTNF